MLLILSHVFSRSRVVNVHRTLTRRMNLAEQLNRIKITRQITVGHVPKKVKVETLSIIVYIQISGG